MAELAMMQHVAHVPTEADVPLTVTEVHARHGEFVWKTLWRMGVRAPHLEDVYQEVFLVVHRRLDSFVGRCAITTWLYEICFRVAIGYRRRAHFRREQLMPPDQSSVLASASSLTPERELERRRAIHRLHALLARLKIEQRVVFVLFELEGLSCEQISAQLAVPAGTVYSRLHRARKAFVRELEQERKRSARHDAAPLSGVRRNRPCSEDEDLAV